MDQVECVVVGAGVVGLAIAAALARASRQVLVLEAAGAPGIATSGRGSGVIHAGLYYPPQSLKARFCLAGREMLYAYAAEHGVPHRKLGKLVVATSDSEAESLEGIARSAQLNGVADLIWLGVAQARAMEPALSCVAALHSPSTGVVDAPALLRTLEADAEEFGAVCAFHAPLRGASRAKGGGFVLDVGGEAPMRLGCRILINAAGHGAQAVATSIESLPPDRIPRAYFAKGNYFTSAAPVPFGRLIYPVPVPGGIGIHLTLDTAGKAIFGPDVEWVDGLDYSVDPGRASRFAEDIRRWWPALPADGLRPAYAGVRPKIAAAGEPSRDFLIESEAEHRVPGLVNLFGIESPGLTCSLAIARHIHDLVLRG